MEFQPTHHLKMRIHKKIPKGRGAGEFLMGIDEDVCQLSVRTGDGQKWVYWFLRKHEFEGGLNPPEVTWSVYPENLKASGGAVGGDFGNWGVFSYRLQDVVYLVTLNDLPKPEFPAASQP
jgi:hypothetical protein